jgi:hypothetical protein
MGSGTDLNDEFNVIGWLNALPDQCGIPGWQRITFMKHFADDLDYVDGENLWAYEGVVLPGGRIMVGRWWFASEDTDRNVSASGERFTMIWTANCGSATTMDRSSSGPSSLTISMSRLTATRRNGDAS